MKRALLLITALLVASLAPAHAASTPSCSTIKTVSVKKGTLLPCLDGVGSTTFEAIRGPVLVNVWGSWCEPCQQEIPHLLDIAEEKKIAIIGIDVEESSMAAGKKFVLAHGMSWPILYDADGRTKSAFGMGVPVTWFLNEKSVVVYRQIGIINSDQALFDEVKKYLKIKI